MASNEVVNTFFDRASKMLPTYVSPVRASIIAVVVVAVFLYLLAPVLAHMQRKALASDNTLDHLLATGTVVGVAVVTITVFRRLRDLFYLFDMLKFNKQHFANLYWLSQYIQAAKDGFL